MIATIEAYKDGEVYVVAGLSDERDDVYLDTFGNKGLALAAARRIKTLYPNASWQVDL